MDGGCRGSAGGGLGGCILTDGAGCDGASFSRNHGRFATRSFSVELIGGVSCSSPADVGVSDDDSAEAERSGTDCSGAAVSGAVTGKGAGAEGVCALTVAEVMQIAAAKHAIPRRR